MLMECSWAQENKLLVIKKKKRNDALLFFPTDEGRSLWENAWRACSEKMSHQTVNAKKNETPKQTQRGSNNP